MLHFLTKLIVLRLRRHLQASTFDVEQPAVIGTTQSAVLDIAVLQRSPAMGTVLAEQPHLAELIAKQEQIFAEDFDCPRNVVEFLRRSDDNPIAAKPIAARRSRPHMRYIRQGRALFSLRAYFHRFSRHSLSLTF